MVDFKKDGHININKNSHKIAATYKAMKYIYLKEKSRAPKNKSKILQIE